MQSQGWQKGTYSSSLLYMPTPLLVGVPSASAANCIFAMLSNSLERCFWTYAKTYTSTFSMSDKMWCSFFPFSMQKNIHLLLLNLTQKKKKNWYRGRTFVLISYAASSWRDLVASLCLMLIYFLKGLNAQPQCDHGELERGRPWILWGTVPLCGGRENCKSSEHQLTINLTINTESWNYFLSSSGRLGKPPGMGWSH